jgi:UDP-3-O-[3-hydroxymyristoyl] glucosamine N-acyltransferase
MKLSALAATLGATLVGDPELEISGASGIEDAVPGQVTFVSNLRYIAFAETTKASAVLVEPDFRELSTATLRIKNPYLAFARTLELLHPAKDYPASIHPTAIIAPSAIIGARAHIAAYVVIGDDVRLGDDAVLHPHVVIYVGAVAGNRFTAHAHAVVREQCVLGDNVVLQNGAIVGADGFGFARDFAAGEGAGWHKILQTGPAVLGSNVEVQANACIDRATVGETRIGDGVKIDNLVQVGHGTAIGADTLVCAQVGIAGSSTIGRNVILAGQSGVVGHGTIGDGAVITAQSGVPGDVPPGATVSGSPAFDNVKWLRATALFQRLPELIKSLRGQQ